MKKNDVIAVRIKSIANGELVEDAEKIIPVGRNYLHKSLEESFLKHNIGDNYKIELNVKEAYGPRVRELIKMIPTRYFKENNVMPVKGLVINVDGIMGKVISASSGRIMVDFNHPLSGKDVTYDVKILSEVTDDAKKASAIIYSLINEQLAVTKEGNELHIKDELGMPKEVKDALTKEIKEIIPDGIIKFIS
ncbi:MAG TPA: hypothetical protein VI790_00050 [Candidatus Nanoarchaeia archaeon]|nr:hypothetical protein [Candidatus Nanoarchaeia archaeon]